MQCVVFTMQKKNVTTFEKKHFRKKIFRIAADTQSEKWFYLNLQHAKLHGKSVIFNIFNNIYVTPFIFIGPLNHIF